jgi:glucose dehydrogenase
MNLDELGVGAIVRDTWSVENASLNSKQLFTNLNTELTLGQLIFFQQVHHNDTYQFLVVKTQSFPYICCDGQSIGVR